MQIIAPVVPFAAGPHLCIFGPSGEKDLLMRICFGSRRDFIIDPSSSHLQTVGCTTSITGTFPSRLKVHIGSGSLAGQDLLDCVTVFPRPKSKIQKKEDNQTRAHPWEAGEAGDSKCCSWCFAAAVLVCRVRVPCCCNLLCSCADVVCYTRPGLLC